MISKPTSPTAKPGNDGANSAESKATSPQAAAPQLPAPRHPVRRPLLQPLVPLYRLATTLRNGFYDHLTTPRTLQAPVISIGSIAAGGAGKTPFLAALARLLQANGYAPDVLSRGYGRHTRGVLRVDPAGTARDFGDEPLMLARDLGIPVTVGSSRHAAGLLAETQHPDPHRVHLLDDGFNHRRLARTLDIALLTLEDTRDTLLPAGNLREPLARLARAHILVLREQEADQLRPLARQLLGPGKPIWTINRTLALPPHVPEHPIVFSAIARPADFETMVRRSGIHAAGTRRYPDHHTLTPADFDALRSYARASHATGLLTTSKDAVKLTTDMLAELTPIGPLAIADALVEFTDPTAVLHDLQQVLPPPQTAT